MPAADARLVSRSLSGLLCGTHSGALARRAGDRLGAEALRAAAGGRGAAAGGEAVGAQRWEPGDAAGLARRLAAVLDDDAVADLILFGSQARGTTTGFSDVDAVLVLRAGAVAAPGVLERLRPRVLAAQRAVLAHQPMQHHGFEVALDADLARDASAALGMPREALAGARSLRGAGAAMTFPDDPAGDAARARRALQQVAGTVRGVRAWPSHPWRLHATTSMFELLPALYVQASGERCAKAESFALARERLGEPWWPYEELEAIRAAWPRRRRPALEAASAAARNPWVAVDAWRRLPGRPPAAVRAAYARQLLDGLHALAGKMAA